LNIIGDLEFVGFDGIGFIDSGKVHANPKEGGFKAK